LTKTFLLKYSATSGNAQAPRGNPLRIRRISFRGSR
jgi:hypothetical protein